MYIRHVTLSNPFYNCNKTTNVYNYEQKQAKNKYLIKYIAEIHMNNNTENSMYNSAKKSVKFFSYLNYELCYYELDNYCNNQD